MEPVAWQVKILPKAQGSSDLSPNPQVVQINDSVFWANQTSEAHRPARQDNDIEWFIERDADGNPIKDPSGNTIPKNVAPGEPSEQVVFNTAGVVAYYCKVHPNNQQEKGTVIVPALLVQIRRNDAGNVVQYDYAAVNSGSYVWWLNVDYQSVPHQPSFAGINAPIAPTDMSAPILFNSVGVFPYRCLVHPNDPNDRSTVIVPAQVQISVDGGKVQYSAASIQRGNYVWWLNGDQDNQHQPSFAGITDPIGSNNLSPAIQFNTPGTFPYTCIVHPNDPNDRGSITVT